MAGVKDNFKRTTISLRPEEYEALRFMAFKHRTVGSWRDSRIDI